MAVIAPNNVTAHQLDAGDVQGRFRGRSATTANLVVGALLAASVAGDAAIAGDLTISPAGADLAASVAGQSVVTADLTPGQPPGAELQGDITGTASLSGDLVVGEGLFGMLAGDAAAAGDLTRYPTFAAGVAGSALVSGDLWVPAAPAQLAGDLVGTAYVTGAFPSQLKPRFAVSKDLFNMLQSTEFGFDATYNSLFPIKVIYKDLSNGILGGTVNLKGEEITMYAWHADIEAVQEGDTISIDTWTFTVREVEPNNHGIVRLKMEET